MTKTKAKAKAKGASNETKHTNNTEWHESEKDYVSFDLDLRPEYYEESHSKLMDAIIALLEKEANNENKGLPKGEKSRPRLMEGCTRQQVVHFWYACCWMILRRRLLPFCMV